MFNKIFILLLFSTLTVLLNAQSDSLRPLLFTEQLDINDLQTNITDLGTQKIVSASRSLQSVEDLPFTIYVITKEDIRNNGYNTLVDALKMVPGIRVSQVGSGVDGQTFLMRGLRGNAYAKILINNIPIKPIGVKGMPLGAQLPIRQAERIEVIYGPAATLYGADASAGVINIILKESERPLYTKADISFGAVGYNSMNILFGGKAGKGKRILKYNVFGNFTTFDNRRISLGFPLYIPTVYDKDSTYLKHPNYLAQNNSSNLSTQTNTPHLSRMFGMELSFGAFDVTLINMYRRDHSSIGLNPTAFSYANPLNFIGETINQVHIAYSRKKKRRAFNIALNTLVMQSDKNSSYRIINSQFNKALVFAAETDRFSPLSLEERVNLYYDNFISGNRYLYDEKIDISLEATWNVKYSDQLEWMTGFTPRALLSKSEYFLRTPYPNFFEDHTRSRGNYTNNVELGAFTQLFYNTPKLKGILGLQYTLSSAFSQEDTRLNPRVALLYKLSSKLSIRGFYGSAFRTPATYFSSNSYTINIGNYDWITLGTKTIKPEVTTSLEGGFRWVGNKHFYADISLFSTATKNFITANTEFEKDLFTDFISSITLGYSNEDASFSKLSGIQSAFTYTNILAAIKLNTSLHLTLTQGKSLLGGVVEKNSNREQPKLIAQLRVSFSPIKNIFIHLDNVFISKTRNQSVYLTDFPEYEYLNAYHTLDMSILGRLTDHFQINFKLNNVFDTSYAGLSATGTPDDLLWNQQSSRTWELGFSYRME